jgi:nucleoside-diphosphate-sugar epimerase
MPLLSLMTPLNLVYVRDVARAIVRASTTRLPGLHIYNLNIAERIPFKRLPQVIKEEVRCFKVPLFLPDLAVRLLSLKVAFLRSILDDVYFDAGGIFRELSFAPHYDLRAMIKETIAIEAGLE